MKIKNILGEAIDASRYERPLSPPDQPEPYEPSESEYEDHMDDYVEYINDTFDKSDSKVVEPLEVVETFGDKWKFGTPFMKDFYDKIAEVPHLKKKFGDLHPLEETAMFKKDIEAFKKMFAESPVKALSRYAFNYISVPNEKGSKLYADIMSSMEEDFNAGKFDIKEPEFEPDYDDYHDRDNDRY
jgi:hypothetical protein